MLSFLSHTGFNTLFRITTKAMLDPTYVAACFRCPPSPLQCGLSHCRPAARLGPGPLPCALPPLLPGLLLTEAEVRVAVRQGGRGEKEWTGKGVGFTQVFTRLMATPQDWAPAPRRRQEGLLTCSLPAAPLHRGHGACEMHSSKGKEEQR